MLFRSADAWLKAGGAKDLKTLQAQIDDNAKESPALGPLTAKILPDKETKTPVEGLLYFSISTTKLKPKDVGLIYNGAAGKLVMEFQAVKK